MESVAVLRLLHGTSCAMSFAVCFTENPASILVSQVATRSSPWKTAVDWRRPQKLLLCAKASETKSAMTADISDKNSQGPSAKKSFHKSIFPKGFEKLVQEVCDETNVAEIKLKIGDFEMHLKRDIGMLKVPISITSPIESPIIAPPIPSEPMVETSPSQPVVVEKSAPSTSPFANVSSALTSKLAALEALGLNAYVLVPSPTVGSFRRGRTLKGKRQPPSCKEGDIIKEGQIIGFLDQFGSDLPVRSDVAGEVLKVLCKDGEPVGYGDPLIAILPSFHGINQ